MLKKGNSKTSNSGDMASRCIDVYVKLSSGRSVQYDVPPSKRIDGLIDLIAADEGVPANQVTLKYQGKVLITTKTVGEYGVRPETILKTQILVPKCIALVINLPDGGVEEITISNLDSTQSLFQIVSDKSGTRPSLLELEYKTKKLKSNSSKLVDVGIENCSEIDVTVREEKGETKASGDTVELMDEDEKEAVLTSFQTDGRQVEVVFSFDTTGSMYQYLQEVRSKLRECCTRLLQDIPQIRIGLIAHGDYCDQGTYVLRSVDLTDNVDTLVSFANDVPSTGGGDAPECYEWVLRKARYLDWSEDSAKALVVIGDLYPHPHYYTDQDIRWRDELDVLKGMGIKVYGIQAGTNNDASNFYAEIAELTEGRHLKLNHFDIITDMFLAVCYREGNEELLEEFQQELQGAGRMTEEKKAMFEELKETDDEKKKKGASASSSTPQRSLQQDWWDPSLCNMSQHPSYVYDIETDVWTRYQALRTSSPSFNVESPSTERASTSTRIRRSFRRKNGKKCNIM